MDRSQKTEAVAQLNAVFKEVGVVVVTRNLGLTVEQSTDLRSKMREAGASYKVAKNRLASLALKDTPYAGMEDMLTGPTALGYSEDPVAAAKAAVDFAKTNDKLEIVGGSMGWTGARRNRDQGACRTAQSRRAARKAGGTRQRTRNESCSGRQRPRSQARPCIRCLRRQRRGLRHAFANARIQLGFSGQAPRPAKNLE